MLLRHRVSFRSTCCKPFVCSISYPIVFGGTRDGILDMARIPREKRTHVVHNIATLGCLVVITVTALFLTDFGLVISILGATVGTLLVYILPAVMFVMSVRAVGEKASAALKFEACLALLSVVLGIIFGVIGTKITLTGQL